MRLAPSVVVVLVGVTTTALADPKPDTCDVRVVRAPEEVRAAIEARIGIESSCTKLDVRVVQTRDGYYVMATPPDGELFEGNVRDAGRVGELVTSWARLSPSVTPPKPEKLDTEEVREQPKAVAEAPPSAAPVVEAREAPPKASNESTRDFTFGVLMTSNAYGVRGEVDVLARGGWSLGVALGVTESEWTYGDGAPPTRMSPAFFLSFRDIRALVVAAKTFVGGPWRLRMQVGAGVIQTQYAGSIQTELGLGNVEGDGTTKTVEAAITASRDLGASWALSIGPLLTYYGQEYAMEHEGFMYSPSREFDVGGYLAIKKRL